MNEEATCRLDEQGWNARAEGSEEEGYEVSEEEDGILALEEKAAYEGTLAHGPSGRSRWAGEIFA